MHIRTLTWIAVILLFVTPAHASVTPLVAGPSDDDSVWVTISVNDTLGNAANADTLTLLWLHEGVVFDSVSVSTVGLRVGQYVVSHLASNAGALGAYQVLVRASVSARNPITNYAYSVSPDDACTGDGPVACTLRVLRESGADTTAVAYAALRVYNSDETATLARTQTDMNGHAVAYVSTGTVHVIGSHAGYQIEPADVTVDFDGVSDTLWATPFDPGAPAASVLCRVYGWVFNLAGITIANAKIEAQIPQAPLQFSGVTISPYSISTETDSLGYWYMDLIPSTLLAPDTTRYDFTIRYPSGAILRQRITVPNLTTWQLDW